MNPIDGINFGAAEASMLAAAIDEIDYGLMLVVQGRVAGLNRAARAALAEPACPLVLREDAPHAVDRFEDSLLQGTLRSVAKTGRRDWLILRATGTSTVIALVPLPDRAKVGEGTAVTLVMGRRSHCARLTLDWYCRRHGLSPAESRVLEEVLAGMEPTAIARKHGVAMSTVRTQIASITEKTGQRGIRQLLVALAGLPPVMPLLLAPAGGADAGLPAAQEAGLPEPLAARPCAA